MAKFFALLCWLFLAVSDTKSAFLDARRTLTVHFSSALSGARLVSLDLPILALEHKLLYKGVRLGTPFFLPTGPPSAGLYFAPSVSGQEAAEGDVEHHLSPAEKNWQAILYKFAQSGPAAKELMGMAMGPRREEGMRVRTPGGLLLGVDRSLGEGWRVLNEERPEGEEGGRGFEAFDRELVKALEVGEIELTWIRSNVEVEH